MSANLKKPFDPSCCDGGFASNANSAQPCGCDPGANWVCAWHKKESSMPRSVRIGVDLDGVVTNFIRAYENLIVEATGRDIFPGRWPDILPPTWDWPQHYGYTQDEVKKVWGIIKQSPDFWEQLEAIPGAVDFVNQLYTYTNNIYFVTDRVGIDPQLQTIKWLEKHGFPSPSVIVSADKGGVCKALSLDFYIDDKLQNIEEVLKKSPQTQVRLLSFPYNQSLDVPESVRIYSFSQFELLVEEKAWTF